MRLASKLGMVLAAIAFAGLSAPRTAAACGGTFCDTGPRPMPVDQTGENIVFVMEPGMVEAHIQIQYKGEAAKFSWILPVQALPDVQVGSEALFGRLLTATVPMYSTTTQPDFCGSFTGVGASSGVTGGAGGPPPTNGGSDSGTQVVFQKPVGAFEVTALSGGTTTEVIAWLTDNGYQVPPNASTLLDSYVANKFFFVAVKLTGGAGIDSIHPLVIRYAGSNPCVPIKLTSVAAVNDMGIRTFFLGNRRVAPKNYKLVVPNLVKFDWFNASSSYNDFISRAIDSDVANGQAWVTEYAGPTAVVSAQNIASASWNKTPFEKSAAVGVVQLLQSQGLMSCFGNQCSYNHPLLLPLLRQYLPAPSSIMVNGSTIVDPVAIEGYFYSCLACYQNQIDMPKWVPLSFAADLGSRIIDPARHADVVLKAWPYLTRMFTTLSPVEMTLDPEFLERDGLGDVALIRFNATQRITCSQQAGVKLPDGRDVALAQTSTWPGFTNMMPFAERIDEINATDVLNLKDNKATIDAQLKAWNASQKWPPADTTGTSTGTGSTGPGAGGSNGADPVNIDGSGCSCRTTDTRSATAWPWAAIALLGLARVRRRARG